MDTNIHDIRRYGAKGDGVTLCTDAFRAAAEACAAAGGGTVLVSGGDYVTGTVRLYSDTTLRIEQGAVLRGSRNIGDYGEKAHLLYAEDAEHVILEGPGAIRGEGLSFLLPPEVPRRTRHPGVVDTEEALGLHFKCKRMRDGKRPSPMIHLAGCDGVDVRGLRIEDASGWTLSLRNCDRVNITGIRMWSDYSGVSVDGIDLTGCRNVVVSGCHIHTADDAIVLKNPFGGEKGRSMYNILITGCTLLSSTNGIKIGTETYHDIMDVVISDCAIYCRDYYPATLTGLSLESVDGAVVENIVVKNLVIRGVMAPFFLRLGNRGRGREVPAPGALRHITLDGIRAMDCDCPPSVTGIPSARVRDVRITNVDIVYRDCAERLAVKDPPPEMEDAYPESVMFGDLPAYGLYARHVEGLKLGAYNVTPRGADRRKKIILEDVTE